MANLNSGEELVTFSEFEQFIVDSNKNIAGIRNQRGGLNKVDWRPATYSTDSSGNVTGLVGPSGVAVVGTVNLGSSTSPVYQVQTLNSKKYRRPPRPTDNATQGYGASSNWVYNGKTYTPVAAPTTSDATWQLVPKKGGMVCDIVGTTNTVFAGGTIAMKAGFTGAAIDISVTIATVATPATINILAGGELDVQTLESYLCQMDAGTYCTVTKIYDQTGNANHIIKNASYAALLLDWDPVLGRYVVTDEYVQAGVDRRLQIPAITGLAQNSFTMALLGRNANCGDDSNNNVIAVLGNFAGGTNQISPIQFSSSVGGVIVPQNPAGGALFPSPRVPCPANPNVLIVTAGAATTTFVCNESTGAVATNMTASLATGGWIGTDGAAQHRSPYRFIGFSICKVGLTAAQITSVQQGAYSRMGIVPQARDRVILLGDSRFSGAWAELYHSFPLLLQNHIQSDCEIINISNGGYQISDCIAGPMTAAQAYYRTGNKNIAVILLGVNNFLVGAKTVAATVAEMTTLVGSLKSTGFKTIVIAELTTTTGTNNTYLLVPQLTTALLANPMNADFVVNVASLPGVAASGNTSYYPDGLHPNAAVQNEIMAVVAPYVDYLLNS